MPKAKKYSIKRHTKGKRYNKSKRGGENTDTLDALEKGEKYGQGVSVPFTYNPTKIDISSKKIVEPSKQSAVEFFEKGSEGIAEKSKLAEKYAEDMRRQEAIKNVENISAEELFSGLTPEGKKANKEYEEAYTKQLPQFNFYGNNEGGRKSRRKRRKLKRKQNKSRKH